MAFSPLSFLFPFLARIFVSGSKTISNPGWFTLYCTTCAKVVFANKVTFIGSWWKYLWGNYHSVHYGLPYGAPKFIPSAKHIHPLQHPPKVSNHYSVNSVSQVSSKHLHRSHHPGCGPSGTKFPSSCGPVNLRNKASASRIQHRRQRWTVAIQRGDTGLGKGGT